MLQETVQPLAIVGPSCCDGGVSGYGSTASGITFIGIAPGRDEVRTGRPLTGPSGKLLNAVLEAVGILRDTVYCTNLICWFKDNPDKDEIAHCSARLQAELKLVAPKVVVLLGKLACESILGLPFSKARGAVIVRDGITYLATYHPAASLHKGTTPAEKELQINAAYDLCRDLSKLPNLPTGWPKPTYTIVNNPNGAKRLLAQLPKDTPIAVDIETNFDKEYDKSHPYDNDIVCIGVGYEPDHAYVLTEAALEGLVWPTNLHYVFHNGAFDTQEIARHTGQWLKISDDTMLMSYSCDERSIRGLHKLKSLAREFVGSDFYEEDDHGIHPHKVVEVNAQGQLIERDFDVNKALEALYSYNAKDVVYTWRLHQVLSKWQQDENVTTAYRTLMLPAAEMLARSQLRGIYVSPKNMLEVIEVFEPQFEQVQRDLQQISRDAGFSELNVNSPKQLMAMFEAQGIFLNNTRKATLQDYMEQSEGEPGVDNEFVTKLLKYRTLHKLIRNYLLDIQKHVKHDSRVHPTPFLIGTSTGRLTYRDPAMQTLPKEKTVGPVLAIVRKIFSATNNDYILLEADYAQIEAWIAAYLSEDPQLLADLQSGNWHTRTTEDVFHVTKDTVDSTTWKFYYDGGKHLNYGCLFEEGPEGLTRRPPIGLGCSFQVAKEYHQRWFQRYHVFDNWRRNIKKQAQRDGYIQTEFGRKRRFPLIVNDHQLRQVVNSPIQSIANDYTLSSNIRMAQQLREDYDTHLLFLEHDGTYLEVARKHLEEVKALLYTEMQRAPLPGMPSIKIEIETGNDLASLEKV